MSPADVANIIRFLVADAFLVIGLIFVLIGMIGIVRFPEFYTRLHAAGVTDTLGAELMLMGLIIRAGFTLDAAKLVLVGLFLFLTSPTATHAIANAAYTAGVAPKLGRITTRSVAEDEERGV